MQVCERPAQEEQTRVSLPLSPPLLPLPPSPHSHEQERSGAELWPLGMGQVNLSSSASGFPLSPVQNFTGVCEIHRREDRRGCDGKDFVLLNLVALVQTELASWGWGRGCESEVILGGNLRFCFQGQG